MRNGGRAGRPNAPIRGQSAMAKKTARRKAGRSSRKGSSQARKRAPSQKRPRASTRRSAASARKSAARGRTATKTAKTKKKPAAARPVRSSAKPTRRSTATPAGAGTTRRAPSLDRARRQLREVEGGIPTPPSSLDLDRTPSAARSGRRELIEARRDHNEVSPDLTAGDVDADWEDAYSVGDEAPGGDNPTPDQDRVDDIGKALGVQYDDNEELKGADKISQRDRHRWELDPASSDDYKDRD
jgi:uncharacterized protein DUF6335